MNYNYQQLKNLCANISLPAMLVDLQSFDQNAERIFAYAKKSGLKLRPATKSVRVPELLKRIKQLGQDLVQGYMCFSAQEAHFLHQQGLDDLLIAYPCTRNDEIEAAHSIVLSSGKVILMIDSIKHLNLLEDFLKQKDDGSRFNIAIDVDMAFRPLSGLIHFGVWRSPVRNLNNVTQLHQFIKKSPHLTFWGIMGYEAQVAGLQDKNPFCKILNPFKHLIRMLSVKWVRKLRKSIADYLKEHETGEWHMNGGGTGSLDYTTHETWLTEFTAGSGFLQGHLFDYYSEKTGIPCLCFALAINRFPRPDMATLKSGGFIASGEIAQDKAPSAYLPSGMKVTSMEGFGEVQTPVFLPVGEFKLGDPLFFRPSKPGEVGERFCSYHLIEHGKITKTVQTYRGHGKVFF